ncbi:hypothetical protein F4560_000888 [Saccharothrix ecbatanensis]|uniref:Uncharacterized protein n=1 Tax=Saccharothrix ecbatanensis TaxID=1105145 RepID=A0A7W9HFA1_9PSEU|nr:hypothetical protein [Saccharothrix ecbatanensis]MBB5801120.1 hypothetical protein [Saccharothrix ecbatanensis]
MQHGLAGSGDVGGGVRGVGAVELGGGLVAVPVRVMRSSAEALPLVARIGAGRSES